MSIVWQLAALLVAVGALAVVGELLFGTSGVVTASVVGTALVSLYGRALGRRLATATDEARQISGGDVTRRLSATGPAELKRLERQVNRLIHGLISAAGAESTERAKLASILDSMQEGVLVVNAVGEVEMANPASLQILGAPASFRKGQLLTSLTGNFAINQTAAECTSTGSLKQAQVDLHDRRTYVQVTAVPLGGQNGGKKALVLVNDLTDLRRVEVTRREFVSNASHELRTPIASISAAAETLRRGALSDPVAADDFLRRIEEDADRMEALVQEMLELSRLESGQTPLHLAPIDPARLIEIVADRLKHQASEAGISLRTDSTVRVAPVSADQAQLERVLSNLAGNALKFTPRGGSITLAARDDSGSVLFSVRDTGRGVPPEHLPHIFERFYKADASRADGGSGLGLAIAKHIVQAHGGTISVESRPGQGAMFTVRLPALTAD